MNRVLVASLYVAYLRESVPSGANRRYSVTGTIPIFKKLFPLVIYHTGLGGYQQARQLLGTDSKRI